MHTIWSGTLVYGRVPVPVGLVVASKRDEISFRSLHAPCGTPIRQVRSCPRCESDVAGDELVRAVEVGSDVFVTIADEELEAAAGGRVLELERFVCLGDVGPVQLDRLYWLRPAEDRFTQRAYLVLLRALERTGCGGVGRLAMRTKEYVALVRPLEGVLALQTLYVGDEVRSPAEIAKAIAASEVAEEEVALGAEFVEQRSRVAFTPARAARWHPSRVRELVERKIEGREAIAVPEPQVAPPLDLRSALEQSLRRRTGPRRRAKARA